MNTDTTDNGSNNKLQGAFGDRGTNVNSMGYGHPMGDQLMAQLEEQLAESETGRLLMRAKTKGNIPVSIMKGNGESGFSPDAKVIYMQISGKIKKIDGKIVLQYVKALREADQHLIGFIAPNPHENIIEYAKIAHAKNVDSIRYVCKFVKELTNSSYFSVLIDAISQLGYKEVYEVYVREGSDEEFFKAYSGR